MNRLRGFTPLLILVIIAAIGLTTLAVFLNSKPIMPSSTPMPPVGNTENRQPEKMQVCPETWFDFLSPIQALNNPYYGQKGQFMTINGTLDLIPVEKFDLQWIKENCKVNTPEPVG